MVGGTEVPVGGCRIPKPEEEEEDQEEGEEDQEKEKEEIRILDYIFKNKDEFLNSMPPGCKFSPTDEEVIFCYLRPKIENKPLPINRIIELNLYQYDPEHLTVLFPPYGNDNDELDEWFFFTPRDRKYPNGMRPRRGAGKGYWKATGADKAIKYEDQTIGFKRALDFYRGKPPKGEKTNWVMYEFRTNDPPRSPSANTMRLDDVVFCKIYKKPDKPLRRRSSTRKPELEAKLEPQPPHPVKVEADRMEQNGGEATSTAHDVNQMVRYLNPYEKHYYCNSSHMSLQTQQPQPKSAIFQNPHQGHNQFALQSQPFQGIGHTHFSILDPNVFMPLPTPHQSIHCTGNQFGGHGLDNFDIMNQACGNSSFDASNIDFGPWINFGNVSNSIDYGNPGLNLTDYGNDAAQMSSNMNGNLYGHGLLHGRNNNGQI